MNPLQAENGPSGSPRSRFLVELFGNSLQFPIANILLEMLLEGPLDYLLVPDLYTILLAGTAQAWFLSRREAPSRLRRLFGNLLGPALYTAIEASLEGLAFFAAPHHLAYWGFAIAIGLLQALRGNGGGVFNAILLVLENVARAAILLVMYVLFELLSNPRYGGIEAFFSDPSHRFVALANILLGLSLGLYSLTGQRYLERLKHTSQRLQTYSEWLLGRDLLGKLLADPQALTLTRRERAVLFADIRGFTRWSDARSPEEVVELVNRYYQCAERALGNRAVKYKFSADEIMAVFADVGEAVAAARRLRDEVAGVLDGQGLGVGIGIHAGPLVEGLLGSGAVRFYDVIGDTVNTAKRIESAAAGGEILVSDQAAAHLAPTACDEAREIAAKGKDAPLAVCALGAATGE